MEQEYIAGKDEFTLNAALVINQIPVLSLVGVPKKIDYSILMEKMRVI